MKIEDSNVILKSKVTTKEKHTSTITKFELTQGLSHLEQNRSKAHQATQLLLNPDFSAYKKMDSQERCKKDILTDLLDRFFGCGSDIFILPQQKPQNIQLKDSALVLETKEEYYKKQTVDFNSQVILKTPNKTYNINLEIGFNQELYELHKTKLTLGDAKLLDPLVINYLDDINPFDNISKLRFEFDLDSDGKYEFIPLLKQGAGFLAYDKNKNGTIDNGSELFGPQTNKGFQELAQYDSDKNGWIDENDPIFNNLKIWEIDESGANKLVSLVDLNIGAIYLKEVQSGFAYQDSIQQINAIQNSNGIYVKNDGSSARMISTLELSKI